MLGREFFWGRRKFELANGGTIFLDEVGNMPMETQKAVLRFLQDKEITRIGGRVPKPVDVRIIYPSMSAVYENGHLPPDVQEYNMLLEAIKKAHGNVKTAAAIIGMPVSTVYRKLRKYDINAKDYLYWR